MNSKIKGKWIVLLGDDIVESGDNVEEILIEAEKKYPRNKLVVAKVPEEGTLIY